MVSVLIVDDDKDMVMIIEGMLRSFGIDVVGRAYNGKQAVEEYVKHKPDLCLVDIMMPIYDGFYAIGNILKINKNAMMIAVTADYNGDTYNKLKSLDIPIIRKPFNMDVCMSFLKKMKQKMQQNHIVS